MQFFRHFPVFDAHPYLGKYLHAGLVNVVDVFLTEHLQPIFINTCHVIPPFLSRLYFCLDRLANAAISASSLHNLWSTTKLSMFASIHPGSIP